MFLFSPQHRRGRRKEPRFLYAELIPTQPSIIVKDIPSCPPSKKYELFKCWIYRRFVCLFLHQGDYEGALNIYDNEVSSANPLTQKPV